MFRENVHNLAQDRPKCLTKVVFGAPFPSIQSFILAGLSIRRNRWRNDTKTTKLVQATPLVAR